MKLHIKNASFGYNKTILLNSINLDISTGEFTCIIGPNGSGKSTKRLQAENIYKKHKARK